MLTSLESVAGLPVAVDPRAGRLEFRSGLPPVTPAVRTLAEMQEVLEDPAASGPDELYFMYRDVGFPPDRERLHGHGVRYDITVILPVRVGREFAKTAGHYHPDVPGANLPYPEIYEVLHGTAWYLLQRRSGGGVADVVVVKAGPGDKVLIPPGYGHITINPGPDVLVMSNLVEKDFRSLYEPYREKRGGAYYCVAGGRGEPEFVPNPHYGAVPSLRVMSAVPQPDLGLDPSVPLYRAATGDPSRYAYLVRPQDQGKELMRAVAG